jgi:hypothetical protein
MHEAGEPNAVVDLLDAELLTYVSGRSPVRPGTSVTERTYGIGDDFVPNGSQGFLFQIEACQIRVHDARAPKPSSASLMASVWPASMVEVLILLWRKQRLPQATIRRDRGTDRSVRATRRRGVARP